MTLRYLQGWVCTFFVLSAAFSSAVVHAASEDLPPEVKAAKAEDIALCQKAGGQALFSDIQPYVLDADFNRDGVRDYVIDQAGIFCDGSASLFGGSGGYGVTVFLSQPGGRYARAANLLSPKTSVVHGPPDRLDVGGRIWGWDGQTFSVIK